MKNWSLGVRLTLGGIVVVLLPLLVVGLFSDCRVSESFGALGRTHAAKNAGKLAELTQAVLQEQLQLAETFSLDDTVTEVAGQVQRVGAAAAGPEIRRLFQDLQVKFKALGDRYLGVFVTDQEGTLFTGILQNGKEYKGSNIASRAYFQKVRQTGRSVVGDLVRSKSTGKLIVVICAPILSPQDGEFLGAVGLSLKASYLTEVVARERIGQTGYAFMTNRDGVIIAHPVEEYVLELDLNKEKDMARITRRMLAGESGVEQYVFNGIPKIAGFAPVPLTGWSVGTTQNSEEFGATVRHIRWVLLVVTVLALGGTILAIIFFTRGITRPVRRVIRGLAQGAEQVAGAAAEISGSSQTLSANASQQAASVEETAATLQQMSAAGHDTAQLTQGAEKLMNANIEKSGQSLKALVELTVKMAQVESDSDKIRQIIKTIDEIAFQTNLLALNAAVEAARAGQAGAGFAVVADEVRNLAVRATEAAKATEVLLDATIKGVAESAAAIRSVNQDFEGIIESATVMGEKTSAITKASQQQANGIGQISHTAASLDNVAQNMAANAEESASASEELSAQAVEMKQFVIELRAIVDGKGGKKMNARPQTGHSRTIRRNEGDGRPRADEAVAQ